MDAALDWKMSASSGQLRIDYTVTNKGKSPLYVVDDMLTLQNSKFVRAPAAIIVRNADDGQRVSLFRGFMPLRTRNERVYMPPGLHTVAPGATYSGSASTALPLKAWHNYLPDKIEPLKGKPTEAVLELQILPRLDRSDPESLRPLPLGEGGSVEVPSPLFVEENATLLRGKPIRIPGA